MGGVRSEVGAIPALDGLRGIAVLWVVGFHYVVLRGGSDGAVAALATVPLADTLIRNGYLGVDLFFLLSGFLLALPWIVRAARGEPPPAVRTFYRRRVERIVPAYYVQLVLLFAVFLPLLRGWSFWTDHPRYVAWNAATHALFLHTTTPVSSASFGINGALWSLAIEVQFYLLLPFAAPFFARRPVVATAAAFAVAALWQRGARTGLEPLVAFQLAMGAPWQLPEAVVRHLILTQLPSYLGHFALGGLLAHAWFAWKDRPLAAALAPLAGAAGFALLAWQLTTARHVLGPETWIVFPASLGLLLLGSALGRGAIARDALGTGPLAWAGRLSYSAYLYHMPLFYLAQRHLGGLPAALFLPGYALAVTAGSWASWRFIEARFATGLRPPAPRRSPAPAAAPLPTAHGDSAPHP